METLSEYRSKFAEISEENARLVGHQNPKQKINYHVKIKDENNSLREENVSLNKVCSTQQEIHSLCHAIDQLRVSPYGTKNKSYQALLVDAQSDTTAVLPLRYRLDDECSEVDVHGNLSNISHFDTSAISAVRSQNVSTPLNASREHIRATADVDISCGGQSTFYRYDAEDSGLLQVNQSSLLLLDVTRDDAGAHTSVVGTKEEREPTPTMEAGSQLDEMIEDDDCGGSCQEGLSLTASDITMCSCIVVHGEDSENDNDEENNNAICAKNESSETHLDDCSRPVARMFCALHGGGELEAECSVVSCSVEDRSESLDCSSHWTDSHADADDESSGVAQASSNSVKYVKTPQHCIILNSTKLSTVQNSSDTEPPVLATSSDTSSTQSNQLVGRPLCESSSGSSLQSKSDGVPSMMTAPSYYADPHKHEFRSQINRDNFSVEYYSKKLQNLCLIGEVDSGGSNAKTRDDRTRLVTPSTIGSLATVVGSSSSSSGGHGSSSSSSGTSAITVVRMTTVTSDENPTDESPCTTAAPMVTIAETKDCLSLPQHPLSAGEAYPKQSTQTKARRRLLTAESISEDMWSHDEKRRPLSSDDSNMSSIMGTLQKHSSMECSGNPSFLNRYRLPTNAQKDTSCDDKKYQYLKATHIEDASCSAPVLSFVNQHRSLFAYNNCLETSTSVSQLGIDTTVDQSGVQCSQLFGCRMSQRRNSLPVTLGRRRLGRERKGSQSSTHLRRSKNVMKNIRKSLMFFRKKTRSSSADRVSSDKNEPVETNL